MEYNRFDQNIADFRGCFNRLHITHLACAVAVIFALLGTVQLGTLIVMHVSSNDPSETHATATKATSTTAAATIMQNVTTTTAEPTTTTSNPKVRRKRAEVAGNATTAALTTTTATTTVASVSTTTTTALIISTTATDKTSPSPIKKQTTTGSTTVVTTAPPSTVKPKQDTTTPSEPCFLMDDIYGSEVSQVLLFLTDYSICILICIGLFRKSRLWLIVALVLIAAEVVDLIRRSIVSLVHNHWCITPFQALKLLLLLYCVRVLWRCSRYLEARKNAARLADAVVEFEAANVADGDSSFVSFNRAGHGRDNDTVETDVVHATGNQQNSNPSDLLDF